MFSFTYDLLLVMQNFSDAEKGEQNGAKEYNKWHWDSGCRQYEGKER